MIILKSALMHPLATLTTISLPAITAVFLCAQIITMQILEQKLVQNALMDVSSVQEEISQVAQYALWIMSQFLLNPTSRG